MKKILFNILPAMLLVACYDPEPYVSEDDFSTTSAVSEIGTVYSVNEGMQICNPSVSQDSEKYPASMLWLNFGTDLHVVSPDTAVYNTVWKKDHKIVEHDRLTVSDTAGKVLWFLMRDTSKGDCEFQDPEWSTHPNFIAYLRGYDVNGSKACLDKDFGIFAVRLSDKKIYTFYGKKQSDEATPHIWVDPSVTEVDTSKKDTTLEGFFGTKNVRLVFVTKDDKIVFRDFANGGKEITLKKPAEHKNEMIDSPLISPDGKFIVYNVIDKSDEKIWYAYIQELSKNSEPVKIEKEQGMMSDPAQPHWFKFGERLFVVWTEFPSGATMLNTNDLKVKEVQNGSVGRTVMREIQLAAGAPSDLFLNWVGDIREISPVPMIGGRSPDGNFLATGRNDGFLIKLP